MKVCCGNGKPYDTLTDIERLGCNHDHCTGPIQNYVYLTFCGTFNTNDCTSAEELGKLLKPKGEQE